jgi:transposase
MAIRVYKYGLLPPTEGRDDVYRVLRGAYDYYQALVRIERERREQRIQAAAQIDGELAELLNARERLRVELDELHAPNPDHRDSPAIKEARERRDEIAIAIGRRMRTHAKAPEVLAVSEEAKKKVKNAEQAHRKAGARAGMYGAKGIVRQAFLAACKPPKRGRAGGVRPRFRREPWNTIEEQIPTGMTTEMLFACTHPGVRVAPLPVSQWDTRSGCRSAKTTLHLRTDNAVTRKDEERRWAVFPMLMHRPLPSNAKILRVNVSRSQRGNRWKWEAHFVVELPDVEPVYDGRVIAVDLGWRVFDDGSRVAMAYDGEGFHELRIPHRLREKREHADSLDAIRDHNLNSLKEELRAFIAVSQRGQEVETVPHRLDGDEAALVTNVSGAWLLDEWPHLSRSQSPKVFTRLYYVWGNNRFVGDEGIFEALRAWLKQDRHIWEWADYERAKVVAGRKNIFYNWLAQITQGAQTVVFEDMDLTAFAAKNVNDIAGKDKNLRKARSSAAPGDLRLLAEHVAKRKGIAFVKVSAVNTTRTCADCRHVNAFDIPENLRQVCASCGRSFDQDENAARNIYALFHAPANESGKEGQALEL